MDTRGLQAIIEEVVKERFPGTRVHEVLVEPDLDNDDDPVLRITVVLESTPEDLARDRLVGFVRHLKSRLLEAEIEEFPLVSFVSKKEAGALGLGLN
ncbi:MAG: hypothetical protein ACREFO_05135 [Acetobacteraceae bacterium]